MSWMSRPNHWFNSHNDWSMEYNSCTFLCKSHQVCRVSVSMILKESVFVKVTNNLYIFKSNWHTSNLIFSEYSAAFDIFFYLWTHQSLLLLMCFPGWREFKAKNCFTDFLKPAIKNGIWVWPINVFSCTLGGKTEVRQNYYWFLLLLQGRYGLQGVYYFMENHW